MTASTFGIDMELSDQSTVELLKQAGVIAGGILGTIGTGVAGYFALLRVSAKTEPRVIAEQAVYIKELHDQLQQQAEINAQHETRFLEMNKFINELRQELAAYRGVPTEEIKKPEGLQ